MPVFDFKAESLMKRQPQQDKMKWCGRSLRRYQEQLPPNPDPRQPLECTENTSVVPVASWEGLWRFQEGAGVVGMLQLKGET